MKIYHSKYGQVHQGDCLEIMKQMESNSIETMITDPPAGISFMNKEFDHHRGGRGPWVEYFAERFRESLRIIKPGGLALVWALPKTSHWTACALEDAGWEIDTKFYHLFGSGWPKGVDISKGIDKHFGCEREKVENPLKDKATPSQDHHVIKNRQSKTETIQPNPVHKLAKKWDGYKTQLKPMAEEWIVCRKPVDKNFVNNALEWGVGGYNIDECRIDLKEEKPPSGGKNSNKKWDGWGFGNLKKISSSQGRYPGTATIDDSMAEELDSRTGITISKGGGGMKSPGFTDSNENTKKLDTGDHVGFLDKGGPSRFFTRINWEPQDFDFFYGGKAPGSEKNEGLEYFPDTIMDGLNKSPRDYDGKVHGEIITKCSHPTVKSLQLMRWLCTLSKPPGGGTVLDIFSGSFSTLIAAYQIDRKFIGIELDEQYCKEGLARLAAAMEQRKFDFEE